MSTNRVTKNQISCSKNLFQNDDGSSMVFYVQPSSDSDDIVQLIQEGGGSVIDNVSKENPGVILLSSNGINLKNKGNYVCTSFIYSCCFNNQLLDIDQFRLYQSHQSSCQSVCDALDKENDCNKCTTHHMETFSIENMWKLLKYMVKCEELWKGIAESKVCGDISWKVVQKKFSLWAFEKLSSTASLDDSLISCSATSLTTSSDKASNNCPVGTTVSSGCIDLEARTSSLVLVEKMKEGGKTKKIGEDSLQHNEENREVEVVEESNEEEQTYVSTIKELPLVAVNCKEKPMIIEKKDTVGSMWLGKSLSEVEMNASSSLFSRRKRNAQTNQGDREESTLVEVINNKNKITDEDEDDEYIPKSSRQLRLYTYKEDLKLLQWIIAKRRKTGPLSGNRIWQFMEKKKVLPNRSWQSMKERFRRHIVPNLKKYSLSSEDSKKLKNYLS